MACIAVVGIPQGVFSKPFRTNEIYESPEQEVRIGGNVKLNFPLQVGVTTSGELQPVSTLPTTIFWPKLIDLASDCHDQNVKLCHNPINPETLVLQTVREIAPGQPLQLWFSEDLMITKLGIPPYLSPINIKGENSYVCQECQEKFERPNLLKLHLALHCDRLSSDTIWNRLRKSNQQSASFVLSPSFLINLNASPSPTLTYPLLPISPTISISSSLPSSSSLFRPHLSTPPPFLPLQVPTASHFNNNNKGFPNGPVSSTSTTASSSTPSPIIGVDEPAEVSSNSAGESRQVAPRAEGSTNGRNSLVIQEQHHQHARLEAIVSNMGKAKNGHVCLYCGKLYSRKYGLKIHIRTHTGYKPLRCKICHRPFGDPSNLNKHVRLHADGSTPYRKVLVRRRDLDRHMRTRHHHQNGEASRPNGNLLGSAQHPQQSCVNTNRTSTITSNVVSSSII